MAHSDLYAQLEAAAMAHKNTLLGTFEALASSGTFLRKVVRRPDTSGSIGAPFKVEGEALPRPGPHASLCTHSLML